MQIGERNIRTVFLLGAGATRGAVRHVLLNGKRLKPPLNGDFFKVADTFARAHGGASAESKRLKRLRKAFKEDLPVRGVPTMEEAFSLLYIAKDFPEIYKGSRGRKPTPGERQEIEDFLRLVFGILISLDSTAHTNTGYDRLATKLGADDVIITLNYDTLLDSALRRRGWDPRAGYGLRGGPGKVSWGAPSGGVDRNVQKVRLLKLHGSVNWFVRGSFADLTAVFEKKPVRVSAPRSNEISGHIRQIVPPIYGKVFKHGHWRQLWDQAYKALREADALVVIGCSLIDTDFHLRALISRIAKWRKKQGLLFRNVFLVDYGLVVRRKWKRALKGTARKVASIKGFDKFLRQELKA